MIELVAGLTAGPAFLALLGPAGTGKTWMLQAAAAAMRRRGQPAVLVRRGELPIEVFPGTAILVDEAARMNDAQLARLAAVRDASVVLADLPAFAARLKRLDRPPAIVPLLPLARQDVPAFATAWLGARGLPAGVLTPPAVTRLFDHSGGVPRLVVQLLRAALAMHGELRAAGIGADAVDEMAALRLGGFDAVTADAVTAPPPAVQDVLGTAPKKPGAAPDTPGMAARNPAIPDPATPSEVPGSPPDTPEPTLATPTAGVSVQPRRRRRRAVAIVLPALAASLLIVAVLAVRHGQPAATNREPVLVASEAQPATADAAHDAGTPAGGSAPSARPHPISNPDAAISSQPRPATASNIPPSPSMETAATLVQKPAVADSPGQAAAPAPDPVPPQPPAQAAIPPAPDAGRLASIPSITVMAPPPAPSPSEPVPAPLAEEPEPESLAQASSPPGLVLVAHAGDTMPDLYAKVYRGVRPPPYSDVVAANRLPLRPGALVVFPTPQDGWRGR
jgi:hypothetical protein